mgnify:CR=1 FL=1
MRKKGSLLKELPVLVVVALVVSLFIKTFLVQFFYIPSGSMENTLQIKDRVAVNKVPFISNTIKRGDVVVFRDPNNWLPEIIDYSTNKYVAKAKSALVTVGVLPNPAKQYLVKRVIGVGGDQFLDAGRGLAQGWHRAERWNRRTEPRPRLEQWGAKAVPMAQALVDGGGPLAQADILIVSDGEFGVTPATLAAFMSAFVAGVVTARAGPV